MSFRLVYSDTIGESERPAGDRLSSLELPEPLFPALAGWMGADVVLTPAQSDALRQGILTDESHFLVSAPTNSGKTLVALLRIFARSLRSGRRFVYVAPLKALAEQKVREFREIAKAIQELGGRKIKVSISTGDYRISEDLPDTPPDETAEILICTPERLEVLLRNPRNREWSSSVDTYVLDEFHILGQPVRGARYEAMVTRLLLTCPRSCLLALSATIGSLDAVGEWLSQANHPLRVISSSFRAPSLNRSLLQMQDKDAWTQAHALEVLRSTDRSLLVFVYRQADAVRLVKRIAALSDGGTQVAAFHSALPLATKKDVLDGFHDGSLRVLVCTTSLALGINTPATDVIVRDTVFFGFGRLQVSEIAQMTGRAGRGLSDGNAYVLFNETEQWQVFATAFEAHSVEPLKPQLFPLARPGRGKRQTDEEGPSALNSAILAEIASKESVRLPELLAFVSHTYSAVCHGVAGRDVATSVNNLVAEKLVYRVENSEDNLAPTRLGRTVSYAGLSAESGALIGGFLRSLISLSEKEALREDGKQSYLQRLKAIDFLFASLTSFEARRDVLKSSFKPDRNLVEDYIERLDPDEKPLLHLWRHPDSEAYPTRRLLSTLRIKTDNEVDAYWKLMAMSVALHDFSRSRMTPVEIMQKWSLQLDLEGRLLPLMGWMLNAMSRVCSGDRCYRLDFMLPAIRALMQDLVVGGGFGVLLNLEGVGLATIEKIKSAGYGSLSELNGIAAEDLCHLGVRAKAAGSIVRLMTRRAR